MTQDLELDSLSTTGDVLADQEPLAPETSENVWGYRKRFVFMQRAIADFFPGREARSIQVLDIGCGNGSQVAVPLATRGFRVMGVDPHVPSIEHARELARGLSNADFFCGYARDLAPEHVFDVVILSEVLEHLETPRLALQEGLTRLASNGIILVTVPNGYGEFEIDSWLFRSLGLAKALDLVKNSSRLRGVIRQLRGTRQQETLSTENQECGHVQFFTRSRLHRLFADVSLAVLREGAGSFLCGPIAHHTLGYSNHFVRWNARITDRLPLVLASGWYFALRPKAFVPHEAPIE